MASKRTDTPQDTPRNLRSRLALRARHLRFLSEFAGFEIATGTDRPAAVCSWCNLLVRDGNPDLPVSHTICESCKAEFEAQPHGGARGHPVESDDESDRVMSSNLNGG